MGLSINTKIDDETHIDEACDEMCSLSRKIGVRVTAKFNGVRLNAYPSTDWSAMRECWSSGIKSYANQSEYKT